MRPAPPDPPEVAGRLWDSFRGVVGWDIGANCGQTLPQMTARFGHVVAFEPAQECYPYLQQWADRHPTLSLHTCAISDVNGTVDLIEIPDKIDTGQLVSAGITGMEWNSEGGHARPVASRTVDSLVESLDPPDFMKIDVEGHELRVLTGAWQTLTDYHPDLLIEFHSRDLHHAVRECLQIHGYLNLMTIRHPHYEPGTRLWFQHGWVRAFGWR